MAGASVRIRTYLNATYLCMDLHLSVRRLVVSLRIDRLTGTKTGTGEIQRE